MKGNIFYLLTATSTLDHKKYYWHSYFWDTSIKNGVKLYKELRWAMTAVEFARAKTNSGQYFVKQNLTGPLEDVRTKSKRSWFVEDIRVESYELVSLGIQDENNFQQGEE